MILPDNNNIIIEKLKYLSDTEDCCLILTTGGTGPSKKDLTPECTEHVCDKMLPGFGEIMRREGMKHIKTSILSRQGAGIRNNTLIVNFPGGTKGLEECIIEILPSISHCIKVLRNIELQYINGV